MSESTNTEMYVPIKTITVTIRFVMEDGTVEYQNFDMEQISINHNRDISRSLGGELKVSKTQLNISGMY